MTTATLAPPTLQQCHAYALLFGPEPAQEAMRYFDSLPEYRAALVWAALSCGNLPLDGERLAHLDAGLQAYAVAQAAQLDAPGAKVDAQVHDLRLRVQTRQEAERRRLAAQEQACNALLARVYGPQDDEAIEGGPQAQAPQASPQDRAVRLMRAALLLIMDDHQGDNPPGGQTTRITPPRPQLPPGGPGGNAIATPTPTQEAPRADIQF